MRPKGRLVYVTAGEMKAVDDDAIANYGIGVLSLMENAGVVTALLARKLLGGSVRDKRIACLAGKGNNGGDGLVASRHLHNWGARVSIVLASGSEGLGETFALQLRGLKEMGVPILGADSATKGFDLLLDALLGYNARGPPREPLAGVIRRANSSGVPILAIDVPSGLDPTTGEPNEPCIVAKATLTLGLPKTGFLNPRSRTVVGDLYLGDVSIPRPAYPGPLRKGVLFEDGQIIRIA